MVACSGDLGGRLGDMFADLLGRIVVRLYGSAPPHAAVVGRMSLIDGYVE